ncbi:MAG: sugar ABC transporter permease [Spirochaetales bacterium]|jgi:multiple sugar transport system permease protein|nr:sugar ABC transporter permease [Spirochaetales bacterium]
MKKRTDLFPYTLVTPALAVTILIIFFPIIQTATMSLFNYVIWKPKDNRFIGLGNYLQALKDEVFWISLRNTLIWIVGVVVLQLLLGFATALLLNRDFKWRGLARSLILIPWVTPSVITALMWRWMYDGNNGVINDLLVRIGFLKSYFPWLANSFTALPAIMIALMWQGFPFFAIMILAGLQAIPKSLYEAAEVDGATTWQKFARITLPMLVPILFTSILLRVIWVANSMDVIYVMTGGGPGYATHTLPVYSFIRAYKALDFGYASTIAIFLTFLLIAIVAGYVIRVLRSQEAMR